MTLKGFFHSKYPKKSNFSLSIKKWSIYQKNGDVFFQRNIEVNKGQCVHHIYFKVFCELTSKNFGM